MSEASKHKKVPVDPERFLRTDHLKDDLKGRSVRGGAVTLASQGARFFLQMGSTAVLARLLSPEDYGLIGMATVFTGFIELFKHMGLSAATVQRAEVNHRQVSTLFWINVGLGLVMTLLAAASAPVVAWFYGAPELLPIVLALSITFALSGFNVQHRALLLRQMRYRIQAQIEIVSMVMGVAAAIITGLMGWGYWALVAMQLTKACTEMVMIWWSCQWRPGLPDWQSGIKPFLSYGSNLTGFQVVNYFSRNFDNVLIGRVWGSQELGLYAKAYQLVLFPILQINTPISRVALPSLSRLQDNPEKYRKYYYKALTSITTVGMPIVAFMFATADNVILLLLGEQWLGTVAIFQWLMPAAFLATFNVATGWVYQSSGRTDKQFRWGLLGSSITVLVFAIGVRWGAIGVAAGFSILRVVWLIPTLSFCYAGTPLRLTGLFTNLAFPACASLGAAAIVIGINHLYLQSFDGIITLGIDALMYAALYPLVWLIIPGGRKRLIDTISLLKSLNKKK
ncbi:MAG: lipopolysaccharide biosynthesis protein [Cyanobacteria bacterium J06639_16]